MATITLRTVKGSPLTNTEVDDNFTNLNTDKYESGDSVDVHDLSVSGNTIFSIASSIEAAGTTQETATSLTTSYSIVTTATTNQGVVLSLAETGKIAKIVNATSVTIKVYPAASEEIDSLGVNTAKSLAPGATLDLVCVSDSLWKTLLSVVVFDSSGTQLN